MLGLLRKLISFNFEKKKATYQILYESHQLVLKRKIKAFNLVFLNKFFPFFFFFLSQQTFHYDTAFWSNKETFNLDGGKTGFDSQETKLPSYWSTAFSKICLGMKIGQQIKFIVINQKANTLYSLITDGQYRITSLGRDTWKSLIGSEASLQRNCNREGFNVNCNEKATSKARIGILGNNERDCNSLCDSRIGFGTGGYPDDSNTCGNEAVFGGDNGDKHIRAMGYILVQ